MHPITDELPYRLCLIGLGLLPWVVNALMLFDDRPLYIKNRWIDDTDVLGDAESSDWGPRENSAR